MRCRPSNFVLTNPELWRETLTSNGGNLVRGMHMLAEDIEAGRGNLKIRQSDAAQFEVGRNLATTPGQGHLPERPDAAHPIRADDENGARDPAAHRAAVDQQVLHPRPHAGEILHQVVRRPGPHRLRHLLGQPGRAARHEIVRRLHDRWSARRPRRDQDRHRRRAKRISSAIASAARSSASRSPISRRNRRSRVASATFSPRRSISPMPATSRSSSTRTRSRRVERQMAERGYLEGSKMANAFNMLRSNDLIWPYVIDNYLKGKPPTAFDLLFWNSDSTRMPAANHSFYLRNCYLDNKLSQGRDGDPRRDARSRQGDGADLQPRDARGPYRAGEIGVPRLEILWRPGAVRARRLRPYRRASSTRRPNRNTSTGRAAPPTGNLDTWIAKAEEHAGSWWPDWVGVDQVDRRREVKPRAAGRRQIDADRGCARKLCQSESLKSRFPSSLPAIVMQQESAMRLKLGAAADGRSCLCAVPASAQDLTGTLKKIKDSGAITIGFPRRVGAVLLPRRQAAAGGLRHGALHEDRRCRQERAQDSPSST